MRPITPALFLAAAATVSLPTVAAAEPLSVEVDVVDTAKDDARTFTFALDIAQEGSCAEASSFERDAGYKLKVCRERGGAAATVLSFELERVAHGKRGTTRRVRVSSELARGKRTIVGKMSAGADATEIAATVR